MDKNHIITPKSICPRVRYANWHDNQKGIGWINRSNSDPQLLLCVEGLLNFNYENEPIHKFEKGTILFIEPNKKHTLVVKKKCTLSTFHFEFLPGKVWANKEYALEVLPDIILNLDDEQFEQFEQFKKLFSLLNATFHTYSKFNALKLESISKTILLKCFEKWKNKNEITTSQRLQPIIDFIRANMKDELNRNIIAEKLHVSPAHVNLIFKKELQCTPTDFINRERCMFASKLIDQGCSIKEACFNSGFHDQGYFTKVFKKYLNVIPTQMKKIK